MVTVKNRDAPIRSDIYRISKNEQLPQRFSKLPHNSKHKKNKNLDRKTKVPPWLMNSEGKSDVQQTIDKPVIGPTFNDLRKHVADQKKRGLPAKLKATGCYIFICCIM
ncbi:hypothetical protein TNCT_540641 [Trichonephila clavata]|uniref:Uncharacterized protein n=1 Tax=Trichonephila clavata TaxID=2740835 RepID=A0A8X6J812_TRICU|nr:hypothetical protein TNCT_540641 [Trichonephila clavata]